MESKSLFARLGGEDAVVAAVGVFYDKLLASERLAPYFLGLDMDALVRKQIEFLTLAFGGKTTAETKDLTEAHASLVARGLSDSDFDETGRLLGEALADLGVGPELIKEVSGIVESTRGAVLGRASGS